MKTRQRYVQGYNAQAVVSEEQIIVAVGVTQEANDVQQLEPMLQTMAHTLEAAGIEDRPKAGLADAGYWSEANIRACSWPEMAELLIATTKDWKQRKMLREKGCPRGRIPKGLSPRDRMERKLLTKRGRALYKKRSVLVEPVFGQVKEGQGFRRFMRRGLGAAQSEWSLAGMTHNLLKLWRSGQAPWGWAKAPWNQESRRPFWGPTSGRCNRTGRPLLSSIAPTPVLVSSPTGLLDKLMAAHFPGDIHLALDRPIGGVEKVVAPATFETAFRCLTSTDVPPPRFSLRSSARATSGSYRQARPQPIAAPSERAPKATGVLERRLPAGFARPALTRNSLQPCNALRRCAPLLYRLTPADRTGCVPHSRTSRNHVD